MSWEVYLAVFAVLVVGSTVQSSVGMGQGLIAAPLLRTLHPDLLPGPIVIAGFAVSLLLAVRNSRRSDIAEVVPALVGRTIGIGIALGLLAVLSERGLTVVIGVIVLTAVGLRIVGLHIARTRSTLFGAGIASGVGGTIAGLAGTPMGLLYAQDTDGRDFRGPMGIFLTVGAVITLVGLVLAGELDLAGTWLGLALLPPIFVGWQLARVVTPLVDRGLLGPVVLILAGTSATVLILSEIF
jgi:uncharacterized membrane protein YfcA